MTANEHARISLLLLSAWLLVSTAAAAQARLSGIVADDSGHPLLGASVQLWGARGVQAATTTNSFGTFRFSMVDRQGATTLLIRRIGYSPLRQSIPTADSTLTIRMNPLALSIQGIDIAAKTMACNHRDERMARELWERVERRYSHRYESVALGALTKMYIGSTNKASLGVVDTSELRWSAGGTTGASRAEWRSWIAQNGYAKAPNGFNHLQGAGDWEYAPLEFFYAQHFVDSVFGRLNHFQVLIADQSGWTLGFCSTGEIRAGIMGTLSIGIDTTLVGATWSFRTQRPTERAGGQAVFAPIKVFDSTAFLLPTSSLFWREGISGDVFHETWLQFRDWVMRWDDVLEVPPTPPS